MSASRLTDHVGHRWRKVRRPDGGGSVWCADCNVRLYQGALYNTERGQRRLAEALDALRDYLLANREKFE
ncbi:MAG: hypothetical protein M3Z84_07415 [Actinomycetota bacterium]|nr:hypothetical protein [Actinomycetota bacterium]